MLTVNFPSVGNRVRHLLYESIEGLVSPSDIPLKPGRGGLPIRYRSALALKLAKSEAMEKAHEIASRIHAPEFQLSVTPPGFLDIGIRDIVLANWLQNLVHTSVPAVAEPSVDREIPFVIQYTYSRCGSLLQLGARAGFVRLKRSSHRRPLYTDETRNENGVRGEILNPLPWLDAQNRLRYSHDSESQLIARCVTVADTIAQNEGNWLKYALQLAQAFEMFHRDCRIVGQPPEIARVRLGWLAVTRVLLKWLLEVGLNVSALDTM
ncbi:MAG: hypothetical protein J7642_02870 [Cyanobacteria bacterium SBC]|nr:hypothetical protein [Cyanobacteria bacterium SBC]